MQPVFVNTTSVVKLHGIGGYYTPRGWVKAIINQTNDKMPRFRVMGDGQQLGEWSSRDGIWLAEGVFNIEKRHSDLFKKCIPKKMWQEFINLNAYRSVEIEFEDVPTELDEVTFVQGWFALLNPDTKEFCYTNYYPPDFFVKDFGKIAQMDPYKLPIVRVGRQRESRSKAQQQQ